MKSRVFILISFIFFITSTAYSQVSIGVQVGPSAFYIKNSSKPLNYLGYNFHKQPITGYYAALTLDIPIKNNFSIQSELSMIRKGIGQTTTEININTSEVILISNKTSRYEYLEIPIIAKYHFHLNEKLSLDLGMGLSMGYLLKITYWSKDKGEKGVFLGTQDISNEHNYHNDHCYLNVYCGHYAYNSKINRWDISPILDFAISMQTKTGEISLGSRVLFDINDAYFYEDDSFETIPHVYNWGMIIYVGYSLAKGKYFKNKA